MTAVPVPSAVLRAVEDCGNDCFTPDGHREGCWMHCHCYDDGPAEPAEAKL